MPLIYSINEPEYREKMASFDYDWTMVKPKGKRKFPKDKGDWEFLFKSVPTKLKEYYTKGYMIVLFTNQSKAWKIEQIHNVIEQLEIPIYLVVAYSKHKRGYKPDKGMFTHFIKDNTIDKDNSFFVGDALGREGDWADSDKQFAINIGIPYYSPEEIFKES